MEDKKMTKMDYFKELLETVEASETEDKEELITFLNKQIENINLKAEKAKEARAKKKAEGDDLKNAIKDILTADFKTIKEIMKNFDGNEDITNAKVVARLSALVKEGFAEKEDKKTEDGKVVKAYRLAE